MDLEGKIDKIFEEIAELGKIVAVQEQKLREINHRMADGQQAAVINRENTRNEMNKRLDTIEMAIDGKVNLQDYKDAIVEMRDTMGRFQKAMIIVSTILVTGSGVIANMDVIKKMLMGLLGVP